MTTKDYSELYNIGLAPICLPFNQKSIKVKNWNSLTREEAKKTFGRKTKFNISLLTGSISNILVLDFDIYEKNGKENVETAKLYNTITEDYPEIQNTPASNRLNI